MERDDNSRKDTAVSFLRLVSSGKVREAYERCVSENFRHHNAYYRGDRESLMRAMEDNAAKNPNKVLDLKLALEDGTVFTGRGFGAHDSPLGLRTQRNAQRSPRCV